ncbi:MAG: restriction endonuclease subunit S [Alphaproteobacteria bacterium]
MKPLQDNIELKEIFDIDYGVSLELINCDIVKNGIPFVSRTGKNNGVIAFVEKIEGQAINPANTISVAASGSSVCSSFYHPYEYYSGFHVFILSPKNKKMSVKEMLFYCLIIKSNAYRYNYGRQLNKTLPYLKVPDVNNIPDYVKNATMPSMPKDNKMIGNKINLYATQWKTFVIKELFNVVHGERLTKPNRYQSDENIPLLTAKSLNNGAAECISFEDFKNEKKCYFDKITIDMFGNCFYHPYRYFADDNVFTLLPKHSQNKYSSIFLLSILDRLKYKFSFGRQLRFYNFLNEKISLPSLKNGEPDWQFMENYIKSLPYSASL